MNVLNKQYLLCASIPVNDWLVMHLRTCNSCIMQCIGFVQHEGVTIPCAVKTIIHLTCTDRPYKANHQIIFSSTIVRTVHHRYSIKYCTR